MSILRQLKVFYYHTNDNRKHSIINHVTIEFFLVVIHMVTKSFHSEFRSSNWLWILPTPVSGKGQSQKGCYGRWSMPYMLNEHAYDRCCHSKCPLILSCGLVFSILLPHLIFDLKEDWYVTFICLITSSLLLRYWNLLCSFLFLV